MTRTATDLFLEPGTLVQFERPAPRFRYIAPVLLAAASLGTGATFVSSHDAILAMQQNLIVSGTSSGVAIAQLVGHTGVDYGTMVRDLQRRSGLTWNELARALGVSRRVVHHWAAGQRPSERHARRIEQLATLISSIGALSPDHTRARLIAPGFDGRSQLSVFEEESQPRRPIPLSTLKVADFVEDDLAPAPPAPVPRRASTLTPQRIPTRPGGTSSR